MLLQAYSPKDNATLVVMMLEVLVFPLDTSDVGNNHETIERKIKEFERYANIEIPKFLKIGIVIRQAEEGPTRAHLIMNSYRLATLQDIKTEVTNVKQAQSAVMAKTGDAIDVDSFTKRSSKGVLERTRIERSCAGTARRRAIELLVAARNRGTTTKNSVGRKATAEEKTIRRS